jgi:hypothetical protein
MEYKVWTQQQQQIELHITVRTYFSMQVLHKDMYTFVWYNYNIDRNVSGRVWFTISTMSYAVDDYVGKNRYRAVYGWRIVTYISVFLSQTEVCWNATECEIDLNQASTESRMLLLLLILLAYLSSSFRR